MKPRPRTRYGTGRLSLNPSTSVFLNCPFDGEFLPLFDALVFTTVCCGFMPRSALETGNVAEPRMERVTRALFESKYSIHDLSRSTGLGESNHARFNMPLELGIAIARRYAATEVGAAHDWLVLVPDGHAYTRFVSDLAGFDPGRYDGSINQLIRAVMLWLATRADAVQTPTPDVVIEAFRTFDERVGVVRAEWGGSPPWADLVLTAIDVARPATLRAGNDPISPESA